MKYTFEIMKEYEDAFRGISVYSVSEDKKLMVDFVALEELEDAQKEIDEAYQRGLDDAWEAAKKIFGYEKDGGIPIDEIGKVFGYAEDAEFCTADIIRHNTVSEAINKIKAYEEKQKADDKIEVGDEVKRKTALKNERGGIVTKEWKDIYYIMWSDGSSGQWDKDRVVKTGRHFDIASILEDLQCGQ